MLVPLRPHRPLHSLRALIPRNNIFCSERPSFWASSHGLDLLQRHWTLAARQYRDSPLGANTYLVRFGHPGHAVSFTTPDALAASLPTHLLHNTPTDGDIIDPERTSPLSHMTAECMAASISIALASQGIPTREHATATPRFDMSTRMVLQPCSYLPRSNPAVGMDLGTFMDRAMLATGHYPLDDAALSHQHVTQACMAINRNFETCQVDVGCIAVSESPL